MKNKIQNYLDIEDFLNDKKILNILNNREITNTFIKNIDNYITYIKSLININSQELKYIISLTLQNENILLFYLEDISTVNYQKIFMYQYIKNIKYLNKYNSIKKRSFDELVSLINTKKKRIYSYFEIITKNNIFFYLPIIEYLETNL